VSMSCHCRKRPCRTDERVNSPERNCYNRCQANASLQWRQSGVQPSPLSRSAGPNGAKFGRAFQANDTCFWPTRFDPTCAIGTCCALDLPLCTPCILIGKFFIVFVRFLQTLRWGAGAMYRSCAFVRILGAIRKGCGRHVRGGCRGGLVLGSIRERQHRSKQR